MVKKALLIVDAQYDFINGSLAVAGAEESMNALADYIKAHIDEYSRIYVTCDWHPWNHHSFKENGGIWPAHCVQHTLGAAIYQPIVDAISAAPEKVFYVKKGYVNKKMFEGYSAVEMHEYLSETGKIEDCPGYKFVEDIDTLNLAHSMSDKDSKFTIDVTGIALDYCVKNTVFDLERETRVRAKRSGCGEVILNMLPEFCPCIGNKDETLKELLQKDTIITGA